VNYLAHAYLSFGEPEIITGNLISDFVKGKKKLEYPSGIRTGIALHRAIDTFTDNHASTRRAKVFFKPVYGLYAGPLADIVYDHFLANDPVEFPPGSGRDAAEGASAEALAAFAERTYQEVEPFQPFFPDRFNRMFPYMRIQNWLYNYRFKEGIFNSFAGLARRARYMPDFQEACRIFEDHYDELKVCYIGFFPELKDFALTTLRSLKDSAGPGNF